MITVKDLVFEYPGKRALHQLCFHLEEQRICALVGPNGAGKTTLLRCIAALEKPFSGSVHVDALNVHVYPRISHKKIAYLADFFGLYDRLTVHQSLQYMASAYGIASSKQAEAIEWALTHLNLHPHRSKRAEQLSRGLRQRLGIAQAIIHQPRVLILDEPASGLDPEARQELSELMCQLKAQGMTLLVSSHILAELEEYSDEMLIIRDGRIVEHMQDIQTFAEPLTPLVIKATENLDGILQFLSEQTDCTDIQRQDQHIQVTLPTDDAHIQALLQSLVEAGFPIVEFYKSKHSMQQSYLQSMNR